VSVARGLGACVLAVTSVVGWSGAYGPSAGASTPSSFEIAPCPRVLAGYTGITCGTLVMRTHGGARLAVAIVHARSPRPRADPIVYLHGGPGGEAVRSAAALFWNSELTSDRDVVVLDQRGGGLSTPLLDCRELEGLDWYGWLAHPQDDPAALRAQRQARRECQQRLEQQGDDPTAVSTRVIAADVAALRRSLGIERWNVLGFSYGGRVALALARDDPEGIRSVLLDSPLPLDKSTFDPARMRGGLEALFAACARSKTCSHRHPNLRAEWSARLRELDAHPVMVDVPATGDHPATTVSVDGIRTIEAVVRGLADPTIAAVLPDLVTGPKGPAIVADVAASQAVPGGPLAASFAVGCREDLPLREPVRPSAISGRFPATTTFWHECDGWRAAPASSAERRLPMRRFPFLVLHGQFDPVIPTSWAADLAHRLHGVLLQYPGRSHGVVGADDPCSIAIAKRFFDHPHRQVDDGCMTSTPLP
jgi:pimeloyl-ACP methyl ester carboxylesterase